MATTKKTSSKSTAAKPAGKARTTVSGAREAAKAAPAPAPAEPAVEAEVVEATDDATPPIVNRRALFDRVKARSGKIKGRDVRMVMDAVLDELGESIVAGETVKIPALGVIKVRRKREMPGANMVVLKLRRKKRRPEGNDPLAEAAE